MTYMSRIDDPLSIARSTPALRGRTAQAPALAQGRAGARGQATARRGSGLLRFVFVLMEWQRRSEERQQVLEMDPRLLRDMGVTRADLLRALDRRG